MEGHKACRQIILPFVVRLSELWCESRQGSCAQRYQGSVTTKLAWYSGGSRNLERGVQLRVHEANPKIFGLPRPLPDVNAYVIIVATGG